MAFIVSDVPNFTGVLLNVTGVPDVTDFPDIVYILSVTDIPDATDATDVHGVIDATDFLNSPNARDAPNVAHVENVDVNIG